MQRVDESLRLVSYRDIDDVLNAWRSMEEGPTHWQQVWQAKGHPSWEEWRRSTHNLILTADVQWCEYQVTDPLTEVPNWRGGMFHAWDKWFYGSFVEKPPTFRSLMNHPGLQNHHYIREIAKDWSKPCTATENPSIITAIRRRNNDIVVVEGMHRACAIALLTQEGRPLHKRVDLFLADWPDTGEPPKLGTWPK